MLKKFDFVVAKDRNDDEKYNELLRRSAANEPAALGYVKNEWGRYSVAITRFADFGNTISCEQCEELVSELSEAAGIDLAKIEIDLSVRKKAVYFVNQNCLRIFEDGNPVYENDNGRICRDRWALSDCGTSKTEY